MDSKTGLTRAILKQAYRDPIFGYALPNGAIVDIIKIEPAFDVEHDTAMAIVGWGEWKQRVPLEILEELQELRCYSAEATQGGRMRPTSLF